LQSDKIESIGSSIVQHGKYNSRIYLMKLASGDSPQIIDKLDRLAQENGYTKIFAKVPASEKDIFSKRGYVEEAVIPLFSHGLEDVCFLAKYFSEKRALETNQEEITTILEACKERQKNAKKIELPEELGFRVCADRDAVEMASLYQEVFESYPFPIFDPEYLKKTMQSHVIYFGIWHNGELAALSSSEMDIESQNAEMTDFATLPQYRGKSLASYLLKHMEAEMKERKIKTAYTIARAYSWGMNLTFAGLNYKYGGTLINNTNICGRLESMNVWYKTLL